MCSLIRNPSTRAHLRLVCCFHPDAASPNAASRHAATAATAMAFIKTFINMPTGKRTQVTSSDILTNVVGKAGTYYYSYYK